MFNFKKHDLITNTFGRCTYRIKTVHRDGTYTLTGDCFINRDGKRNMSSNLSDLSWPHITLDDSFSLFHDK